MKRLTRIILLIIPVLFCTSWGFFAHQQINYLAIFALPGDMLHFYKKHYNFIREHAVDPDKRRYTDPKEAPRHYIDIEDYESSIDSIPEKWAMAVKKYGENFLGEHGSVPWHIEKTYYQLVKAFQERDSRLILKHSANLGHYIADAHVPLHTSNNHDGQRTGQQGLHAFWESRVPELFAKDYHLMGVKAHYIAQPLQAAWQIIRQSHQAADSVIRFEAQLNREFPPDQKYAYSRRNKLVAKQYSFAYAQAYQEKLDGMVEKRMRQAIQMVASFWYSAWVDAGQPLLP